MVNFRREDIIDVLNVSVVEVAFTKKDGTERVMICTLIPTMIPEQSVIPSADIITVFDLDLRAWRSFYVDSVSSVKESFAHKIIS